MAALGQPLSAYQMSRNANEERGLRDIQGVAAAQGILQKRQAMQEIEQIKAALPAAGGDPEKAYKILLQMGTPQAVTLATHFKGLVPKPPEPYTLSPGATRYDAAGKLIATAPVAAPRPPAPAPFTLTPGATRYDPTGKPIASVPPAEKADQPPVVATDAYGNTRIYDRKGNLIKDLGNVGKPNTEILKDQMARAKMQRDLTMIEPTLEEISKEGGLLDQATGSGAGALADIAAGFFGYGTPGAIAIGKLKPATDAVLKLVPRFEGPQSDKDTKMYQDAAGNLANPSTPNSVKKEAAKTILKLYRQRKKQFVTRDYEVMAGGSAPTGGSAPSGPVPAGVDAALWAVMTPEEKALWQK